MSSKLVIAVGKAILNEPITDEEKELILKAKEELEKINSRYDINEEKHNAICKMLLGR